MPGMPSASGLSMLGGIGQPAPNSSLVKADVSQRTAPCARPPPFFDWGAHRVCTSCMGGRAVG